MISVFELRIKIHTSLWYLNFRGGHSFGISRAFHGPDGAGALLKGHVLENVVGGPEL